MYIKYISSAPHDITASRWLDLELITLQQRLRQWQIAQIRHIYVKTEKNDSQSPNKQSSLSSLAIAIYGGTYMYKYDSHI